MPVRKAHPARRTRRVTQHDLARILGVDRTTVTKILNNDPNSQFHSQLVEHVQRAAQIYGYRNLRSTTKEIAFVAQRPKLPSPVDSISYRLLQFILGINDAIADRSGKLMLVDPETKAAQLLNTVDAIIFLECKYLYLLQDIPRPHPPYIVINRIQSDYDGAYVIHDVEAAYALTVDHLVRHGHRRMTYLTAAPQAEARAVMDRIDHYLQPHGLKLHREHALWDMDCHSLDPWTKRLVDHGITAVIASHDGTALRLLNAARRVGLRLPEDLSVIGNNRVPYPQETDSEWHLTSVITPWYDLAHQAAALLIESVRHQKPLNQQIVLPPDLYLGNSVATLSTAPARSESNGSSSQRARPRQGGRKSSA